MSREIDVYRTAKDTGERLSKAEPILFEAKGEDRGPTILVDDSTRFQTVEGFGGAFTEAAATTLQKLSPANQEAVLKAYFDPDEGIAYSLCRTHINSCDFSLGNYAYSEVEGDFDLEHFSIERDQKALIPMIKRARDIAGGKVKLFGSPWSPPAWMKTNGEMNHGGKLKPECRDVWGRYFARYIREYEKEGVPVWGVSVQNEAMATQRWDSCEYTAEEERDFVRDHLGPALEKEGLGDVKIIIWDHNRDWSFIRSKVAYDDPEAAKYIWGTGIHWYTDDTFENLQLLHDVYPDKKVLFTEGCQEGGPHIGEWGLGERYAHAFVHDLNKWVVGWVDWNLLLDETGGPNHVNNLCSAPIIADTKRDDVLLQSSYYYIGHFSRFIPPGSQRIICSATKLALESTAFVDPDGIISLVVLNRGDGEVEYTVKFRDEAVKAASPAHSITTYRFKA